jgi:hypothetical protein
MRTRLLLDRNEKRIIASTWQDVEPILDHNKALRSEAQHSTWCRHVATIPNLILVKWLNEEYARGNTRLRIFSPEFNELVARKLRDPDWKYLRTDE